MNEYIPISSFHTVYLVDITPSLCEVAQKRFDKLGWTNVKVLCLDALEFVLEEEDEDIEIGLVTMSYSLSMMQSPYPIIDKICDDMLSPRGIIGVVDFGISNKNADPAQDPTRYHSKLTRWFWSLWFVSLFLNR
jgi:betaine lipid synthase